MNNIRPIYATLIGPTALINQIASLLDFQGNTIVKFKGELWNKIG